MIQPKSENNFLDIQMIDAPLTTKDYLYYGTELLREKNISEPRLNTELILCSILNCSRFSLYLEFDKPLSIAETNLFNVFTERRIKHEPLQQITGQTSFYGFDIKITKDILIPRPETEILVEKILTDVRKSGKRNVSVFEIGTGSGCISIALAKCLEKENTAFDIFSIDISENALAAAYDNLKINNLEKSKIRFIKKDVFEIEKLTRDFDYIVSNPPYISLKDFQLLEPEVKDHEPDLALTDFDDGLTFYRRIFKIASDQSFKGKVFCEISFGQKEDLVRLLEEFSFNDFIFHKDYGNIYRILELTK